MSDAPAPGVAIVAAARTPVTGRSRAQGHLGADQLAAPVLRHLASAAGQVPAAVVLGNCCGPGGNPARVAALGAGFGTGAVGWSVDAQCGAGLVAIQQAADHVLRTGAPVAAGGTESASTAPARLLSGVPYRQAPMAPAGFADPDMTEAADDLARQLGLGRERQDAFAARSHALALEHAALRSRETVPGLGRDDGPRRLGAGVLSRFRPVVDRPGATVTPATAARVSDGAAAVLLVPAERAGRAGTATPQVAPQGVPKPGAVGEPGRPMTAPCLLRAWVLTGGDPALPGLAPVAAVRAALDQAGVGLGELAAVELVEAYAAQALASLDGLGLVDPVDGGTGSRIDPRVNAAGGALALGHPWGASGALAVVRLVHRLDGMAPGSLGVAACAIGGGMGAAMVLERLP
ncbi:thiolase family protein [Citricoccus sp. I39-566]|uniref:thiolase family protein n=1 Tax=Citricoccus sp. I39-566 TaxID=3073268 RepID=UPI00286B98AB|nr:thiolase family protein [Citricoccus sp. I39-566]WMY78666.1 thiolase family protein [Citricoccus sp. I39-566]